MTTMSSWLSTVLGGGSLSSSRSSNAVSSNALSSTSNTLAPPPSMAADSTSLNVGGGAPPGANASSGAVASRSPPSDGGNSNAGDADRSMWTALAVEIVSMGVSYALLFVGLKYFMKEMDPLKDQKRASKAAKLRLQAKLVANGRQPFEMDDYEMIVSNDLVYPEDIDVTFGQIGGLERVKQEVFDIVALPLRRPDLFQSSALLSPPKGILLYGPPGTGKTMMAKAIAKESGAAFINLQMSTTMNKWFGESQKLVRAAFTLAWKLAPCVIFIDEIDSFLRERASDEHAAQGNMKAEFMALWDGMLSQDGRMSGAGYGVIVVGATNRPGDVDSAILRRMPRTFKMDLPDENQRLDILRLFLKNERLDEGLRKHLPSLAQKLQGYSGSDMKELCQAAAMRPFREFAQSCREEQSLLAGQELRELSLADFVSAMQDVGATGQAAYEYQEESKAGSRKGQEISLLMLQSMMQALLAQQQMQQPLGGGSSDNNRDNVD